MATKGPQPNGLERLAEAMALLATTHILLAAQQVEIERQPLDLHHENCARMKRIETQLAAVARVLSIQNRAVVLLTEVIRDHF